MHSFKEQLNESSLSRIYQHFTSDRPIGVITAFRGEYSQSENEKRNRDLAKRVRKAGYGFVYVDGAWIENEGTAEEEHVSEVSLMIIAQEEDADLRTNLEQWAKKYDQDAFVFKPGAQSERVEIVDKQGKVLDTLKNKKFDRVASIYTRIRRGNHAGRSFVLEGARARNGFGSALYEKATKG